MRIRNNDELKLFEEQMMPRKTGSYAPGDRDPRSPFHYCPEKVSGVVIRKSAGLLSIGIDMLFVISRIMVT